MSRQLHGIQRHLGRAHGLPVPDMVDGNGCYFEHVPLFAGMAVLTFMLLSPTHRDTVTTVIIGDASSQTPTRPQRARTRGRQGVLAARCHTIQDH